MRRLARWGFRRPSEVRFMQEIVLGHVATGVSSEALAQVALGYLAPEDAQRPWDHADWTRCVRTYYAAPLHLRRRVDPLMRRWALLLRDEAALSEAAKWPNNGVLVAALTEYQLWLDGEH